MSSSGGQMCYILICLLSRMVTVVGNHQNNVPWNLTSKYASTWCVPIPGEWSLSQLSALWTMHGTGFLVWKVPLDVACQILFYYICHVIILGSARGKSWAQPVCWCPIMCIWQQTWSTRCKRPFHLILELLSNSLMTQWKHGIHQLRIYPTIRSVWIGGYLLLQTP